MTDYYDQTYVSMLSPALLNPKHSLAYQFHINDNNNNNNNNNNNKYLYSAKSTNCPRHFTITNLKILEMNSFNPKNFNNIIENISLQCI